VLACGGGGGGGGAGPSGGAGSAAGQPGRKSTLPVHALVHAFHCTDDQCVQKTCPETKGVLKRMRLHVEQCRSRADPSQPPECKVCKLWQALHRTRQNSGQPSASQGGNTRAPQQQGQHGAQSHGAPPPMPGVHGGQRPAGVHPGGGQHTSPQRSQQQNAQQEALRQKLRQLDPAQVKKMLLAHVRNCQNKACPTCHKLRERIRQSRAHQQHAQGGAGGGMGGMGGYTMGMQGSFNPLVSSHSGLMSANAMGGYDGWGGGMSQGSLYSARAGMPSSARPGDGQRRNKVKQRGRENVGGLAAPSRQRKEGEGGAGGAGGGGQQKYTRIRLKLASQKPIERQAKAPKAQASGTGSEPPDMQRSKSTKKRSKDEDAAAGVKRQRSSGGGKALSAPDDDEMDLSSGVHQIKAASDRISADGAEGGLSEKNRYEKDQLIEVCDGGAAAAAAGGEWRLAVVRSCNEQGLYTIQYEPVEQNRHKQTGVEWASTRVACMHRDCKQHQLFLAALPLFCDRCKKALIQAPQQRIYFQETLEAAENAGSTTCIRLCNACHTFLRTELKTGGNKALLEETAKFTREHQGGERTTPLQLDQFEECPVPQRVESSSGPIMSTDIDGRWVQCEHCHKWYHWVCGLYDDAQFTQGRPYYCHTCKQAEPKTEQVTENALNNDAVNLTQIPMSEHIEKAVAADLEASGVVCEPITIRIVSSLLMTSYSPEKLVEHQQTLGDPYPKEFPYKSKALLAFQKREGYDVCLFALYVQEYGSDCPEPNKNRVYISYLDSVRYFLSEPDNHRSTMYHAILVAYLQWTRMLGFKYVHIWVEPPKMGDEYIYFARSDQQRKPMKREKLREWYKRMLDKAKEKGIVESYGSMQDLFGQMRSVREIPLFHGDQWEATVPSLLGLAPEDNAKGLDKDGQLLRMDAKNVVQKAHQEMNHLKRHFLVVVFAELDEPPAKDEDPVISTDITDNRQNFLGQCQMSHWQFSTLRHAQYSTMMILNHIHNKPSYCIEACQRGRVEDGSFMVGCDFCDGWYHGACVGISKDQANQLESYVCPNCCDKGLGNGAVGGATYST